MAGFPSDGLEHHFALVVDTSANQTLLYVDGVVKDMHFALAPTTSTGTNTRLGRQFDPYNEFVSGSLRDVRIYSGPLSAGEVQQLAKP